MCKNGRHKESSVLLRFVKRTMGYGILCSLFPKPLSLRYSLPLSFRPIWFLLSVYAINNTCATESVSFALLRQPLLEKQVVIATRVRARFVLFFICCSLFHNYRYLCSRKVHLTAFVSLQSRPTCESSTGRFASIACAPLRAIHVKVLK